MSNKIATTIYLKEQQKARLEELNERLKVPQSELVRQGIDLILKQYEEKLSGQIPLFEEKELSITKK